MLAQAVYSGFLNVTQQAATRLREYFSAFEKQHPEISYLYGERMNGVSLAPESLSGVRMYLFTYSSTCMLWLQIQDLAIKCHG